MNINVNTEIQNLNVYPTLLALAIAFSVRYAVKKGLDWNAKRWSYTAYNRRMEKKGY